MSITDLICFITLSVTGNDTDSRGISHLIQNAKSLLPHCIYYRQKIHLNHMPGTRRTLKCS